MASQKSLCEVKNYPMAWFHTGLQVQVLLYIVQSFCKFRYSHTQYSPFASSGTAIHCTVLSQVQVLLYTIQSFCKFRYCHTLYSPFANSGTLYTVQSFCKFRYCHTLYSPFANSGTAVHCTVLLQIQVLPYTVQSFCKFRYCCTLYSPFANSGTAVHCTVLLQIQVLPYTVQSFCKFRYCRTLYSPFANSGTAVHCTVLLQIQVLPFAPLLSALPSINNLFTAWLVTARLFSYIIYTNYKSFKIVFIFLQLTVLENFGQLFSYCASAYKYKKFLFIISA